MVFKIQEVKLFSEGEERIFQDQAVQRGLFATCLTSQDINGAGFCFQLCIHPETEVFISLLS